MLMMWLEQQFRIFLVTYESSVDENDEMIENEVNVDEVLEKVALDVLEHLIVDEYDEIDDDVLEADDSQAI